MILFKSKEVEKEYPLIRQRLRELLIEMACWVNDRGYAFIVTDLMSEDFEDSVLRRVSKSHQEGRAADIRVRDWPIGFRKEFEDYFERKYESIAAISKHTGLPNLIITHDNGNGIHCHIQLRNIK
jgi:hypothetical protein